jgi:hypothetical protein
MSKNSRNEDFLYIFFTCWWKDLDRTNKKTNGSGFGCGSGTLGEKSLCWCKGRKRTCSVAGECAPSSATEAPSPSSRSRSGRHRPSPPPLTASYNSETGADWSISEVPKYRSDFRHLKVKTKVKLYLVVEDIEGGKRIFNSVCLVGLERF